MAVENEGSCALPEGLHYYLLRGNIMVPLIPADQLPYQLREIPRHLSHRQMSDEGWKLLKETRDAPSVLPVHAYTDKNRPAHYSSVVQTQYRAPDHHVRTELSSPHMISDRAGQWSQLPPETVPISGVSRPRSTARGERSSPLYDTIASVYHKDAHRQAYPSGLEPDPSKKVYCTYWIKKGTCDFMPIGCKYKHEMPDIDQLRQMGISNEIPKWWRDKNTVKPQTWMQQKIKGKGGAEQAGEVPAPRTFPDPSTFTTQQVEERDESTEGGPKPRGYLKRNGGDVQPKPSPAKAPPSTPAQTPVRRTAQILNLIDLEEDAPAPSSPQLSHASSEESSVTPTPSSHSSATSPTPSATPLPIDPNATPDETRRPSSKNPKTQDRTPRRPSRTSWASDSSNSSSDTPTPTPTKQSQHPRQRTPAATDTLRNVPPRRGLANSKYAVPAMTPPSSKNTPLNRASEHRGRRANGMGGGC
ncbi:hypothetical protein DDE82_006268 [Stemphylium lycopersici]|uniref:C3H1-type domain-containing protein n=1 Tax=Stemphylium lycopersici TaxID=183478 RepID=A0A364MXX4_STELY|nr:hypothetical protein DDE82_006268 [Stemphylium lycopersici]RAR06630.1 hypothetical protein DDE83_006858 [Stemphylium lycopersici]